MHLFLEKLPSIYQNFIFWHRQAWDNYIISLDILSCFDLKKDLKLISILHILHVEQRKKWKPLAGNWVVCKKYLKQQCELRLTVFSASKLHWFKTQWSYDAVDVEYKFIFSTNYITKIRTKTYYLKFEDIDHMVIQSAF